MIQRALLSRFLKLSAISFLLAMFFLTSCAPAVSTPTDAVTDTQVSIAAPVETATLEAGTLAPTPAATSRGPDLAATDPSTVSLASGQLQLVEFFRFT